MNTLIVFVNLYFTIEIENIRKEKYIFFKQL